MVIHQKLFLLLLGLLPLQIGRHFWPEWSYVWGLRVDYLSPTIYLTDILVFLIFLFWGFEDFKLKIRNCKFRLKISNRFLFFLFFLLFLLVNCLLAKNSPVAFYKFFKILEFFLLGMYVVKNIDGLELVNYGLIISVVYSSLIAIGQFIKQSSLGGIFWWLGERTFNLATPGIAKIDIEGRLFLRPYATFSHPNSLAGFLLVSLILTFPFLIRKNKIFAICYLILAGVSLIITFSRSAWLGGILLLFWFILKKVKKITLRFLLLFLLIFVLVYLIKLINFSSESFFYRWNLAKVAVQLIKQSPLIGVGLNNFIVYLPEFWQSSTLWLQPVHNIYLLIASEAGIIGLVFFFCFLFFTYRRVFVFSSLLLTSLNTILLLGFFDHYWLTLQQNQLLLTIILGLIWIDKRNKIKTTNENYQSSYRRRRLRHKISSRY
ncbi:MAG: O-antigen ligase family protein [Microgenomates group bacterium]